MALVIERNLAAGIPQTIIAGFAPRGIAWHWTAGGTGRAGALGTIQHFINTRTTVNASYHILLFRDAGKTVAMWIVPSDRASHSMNPAAAFVPKSGSAREKARFVEVHRILARDTDPNADVISVSFCGMPADLAAAMADPVFVADVRELARQLIARDSVIERPHFGHGWIQPSTRYEADRAPEGVDLLIGPLYGEGDMQFWKPVQEDWTTKVGATFFDGTGAQKSFTTSERVTSIAESSDGTLRLVKYPSGSANEILVMPRAGLNPIAGTRIPATGYGFAPPQVIVKEVPTGITQEQLDAAKAVAAEAEQQRIANAERDRIRAI